MLRWSAVNRGAKSHLGGVHQGSSSAEHHPAMHALVRRNPSPAAPKQGPLEEMCEDLLPRPVSGKPSTPWREESQSPQVVVLRCTSSAEAGLLKPFLLKAIDTLVQVPPTVVADL